MLDWSGIEPVLKDRDGVEEWADGGGAKETRLGVQATWNHLSSMDHEPRTKDGIAPENVMGPPPVHYLDECTYLSYAIPFV